MRPSLTLAAFGLIPTLIGCHANPELCAEYTDPLDSTIEQLSSDLETTRATNRRLSEQVARLEDLYETPETLSIDEVSREFSCLYVAQWNVWASYDEAQHHSPGIAYDFAIVPVLEDHGVMVKSFMLNSNDPNVAVVLWFPKSALTADYKATAWYGSLEEGESKNPFDGTEPFTCRK